MSNKMRGAVLAGLGAMLAANADGSFRPVNAASPELDDGTLGNYWAGQQTHPDIAWMLEREIAGLKPYKANVLNIPGYLYHRKNWKLTGDLKLPFFDGGVGSANNSNKEYQTNFPAEGLPTDEGFVLRNILVRIDPCMTVEAGAPAFANTTAIVLGGTAGFDATKIPYHQYNIEEMLRLIQTCMWKLKIGSFEVANGMGLHHFLPNDEPIITGTNVNDSAATAIAQLRLTNPCDDPKLLWDPGLVINSKQQIAFELQPTIAPAFVKADGTAATGSVQVELVGKKMKLRQ